MVWFVAARVVETVWALLTVEVVFSFSWRQNG
jgi:hypothetical protein